VVVGAWIERDSSRQAKKSISDGGAGFAVDVVARRETLVSKLSCPRNFNKTPTIIDPNIGSSTRISVDLLLLYSSCSY